MSPEKERRRRMNWMKRARAVEKERGRYKKTRNRSERNQKIPRHIEDTKRTYYKEKTTIFVIR